MKKNYYYILKKGWYYRPDSRGYTAIKEEAGQFDYEEMTSHLKHCKELKAEKV